jgi:hypothetical protein
MAISPIGATAPQSVAHRLAHGHDARQPAERFASFFSAPESASGSPAAPARQSTLADLANNVGKTIGLPGGQSSPDKLTSLRARAQDALAQFQQTLGQALADGGVDSSREIHLQLSGAGEVRVLSNNPDRAKIEQIFDDNPNLVQKFQALSDAWRQLQAAEKGSSTSDALFSQSFSFRLIDGQAQASFD